ncbi:arylsulfatase [Streptobacillus felis]|uniref:Arylsulfatase n=1 Tax=Streptobacillus felis TaxID=1384509 RepID=A0A7Z0PGN7_9FUSO|nr:arylsulfatase [Streptobacillus felis]NYV27915.1 arylsulfatase [Streptobacillus felis]
MKKKNVVLIVVDQLRYDSLGINGNEIISTPHLDFLADEGYNFNNAYTATPSCVPARASLLTGLKPVNHGHVGYEDGIDFDYPKTIATEFSEHGYYCKCIGKMHVYPARRNCGFHHIELHDGYLHENRKYDKSYISQYTQTDDYLDWLKEKIGNEADLIDLGLDCNSWVARPWQYEEKYHPTNWVVTRGLDFLRKRDTTMPFFLKLSFVRPHSPLDPPKYYYDMYANTDFPTPPKGDWIEKLGLNQLTKSIYAKKGILKDDELKRAIAAYYGLITHIDHQIGRFLIGLEEHNLLDDTIIMFVSDHGDELGDHNLLRKGYPYQGSTHIPLFIYDKDINGKFKTKQINEIVELRDIFPTLIELATNNKTKDIDGKSMLTTIKDNEAIHEYLHCEHTLDDYSSQFIITKDWKYIWYSQTGVEQLFNISNDKKELHDLINENEEIATKLRNYLINELKDREEGYVENNKLVVGMKFNPTLSFKK